MTLAPDIVEARYHRVARWTRLVNTVVPLYLFANVLIRRVIPDESQFTAFFLVIPFAYLCVAIIVYKWWLIDRYAGRSERLDAAFAPALQFRQALAAPGRYAAVLAVTTACALGFTALLVVAATHATASPEGLPVVGLAALMLPPFYAGVWIVVLMRRAVQRGVSAPPRASGPSPIVPGSDAPR